MKTRLAILMAAVMLLLAVLPIYADTVIDYVLYTDIRTYINDIEITSYNIKGNTAVVVEDLANYGFDVAWNGAARTLKVVRNTGKAITGSAVTSTSGGRVGDRAMPVYATDIKTFLDGVETESYNVGGRTIVFVDNLAALYADDYKWNQSAKTLRAVLSGTGSGKVSVPETLDTNKNTSPESVILPPINKWELDCDWFENSSYKIQDDTIVMTNSGGNHYSLKQTISVKKNTAYRFSADVKVKDYKLTETVESGASVRFGLAWDQTAFDNDFVREDKWTKSCIYFNSGDSTTVNISLAFGVWSGACKGTAYFKNMKVEEVKAENKDNHWNILALIYDNVNVNGKNRKFNSDEVKELRRMLSAFPKAVDNLSDSRMIIDKIDVIEITDPITSISGSSGDLTKGEGCDINFDKYLEGKDYQQIVVYAPIAEVSNKYDGWLGLGGEWFTYDDLPVYYLIINQVLDIGTLPYHLRGGEYDSDTSCLLHELLHCVETNSKLFNGWDGFTRVHDNSVHGYVSEKEYGWLDWYSALMRDDGLDGKGFKPESFLVQHHKV